MKKEYLKTYLKIIFFLIIIGAIIYAGVCLLKKEYDIEKVQTIKTDMLLIESKVEIIQQKVNMKDKDVKYVGKKISKMADEEDIKKLQENGIIDINEEKKKYYVLDKSDINQLGLEDLEIDEGYYIVDYISSEVIYSKGVQDKAGNYIYKLSDLKNI